MRDELLVHKVTDDLLRIGLQSFGTLENRALIHVLHNILQSHFSPCIRVMHALFNALAAIHS